MRKTIPPLRGDIILPGDKSLSHRALLLSAISDGSSRLTNLSSCEDVGSSASCIIELGATIRSARGETVVGGNGLRGLRKPVPDLDCGNSGTTMRLLPGILSGQNFSACLTGDSSLRRRPMKRVIEPLASMGATFAVSDEMTAPFTMTGTYPLRPIHYTLPIASAQVKSALILAGLYASGPSTIVEAIPSRDHTERLLETKADTVSSGRRITVEPRDRLEPLDMHVPGDPSTAAFLIAAATLVKGSEIRLRRMNMNPTRTAFLGKLAGLGASWSTMEGGNHYNEPYADICVTSATLTGSLDISGPEVPSLIDEIPLLAVVASLAGCACDIRDASELRKKESDRIALLVKNLRAIGCEVEEHSDGFASQPKFGLIGAHIETGGDHRIAMAFGVAGLVLSGVEVDDRDCVGVSYPEFWDVLGNLQKQ